jgi:hypothetical protein
MTVTTLAPSAVSASKSVAKRVRRPVLVPLPPASVLALAPDSCLLDVAEACAEAGSPHLFTGSMRRGNTWQRFRVWAKGDRFSDLTAVISDEFSGWMVSESLYNG